MGNLQQIMANMNDSQKVELLRIEGLLNDELVQLYYRGEITCEEIHEFALNSYNKIK